MTHQKIKAELKKLVIDQKKIIRLEWDCGHDESPMWFFINDKTVSYKHKSSEVLEELRYIIIEKLDLPNASDYSVKGQGVLYFNSDGNLFIQFDAIELYEVDYLAEWDGEELISTSKYQNQTIPIKEKVKLPITMSNISDGYSLMYTSIQNLDDFCIYHDNLTVNERKILKVEFLKVEESRIKKALEAKDDDYKLELSYSLKIYSDFLFIEEMSMIYEKITQRWKKIKTILIP